MLAAIKVGRSPYGIAVTPDGTKVYVANCGNNENLGKTISIIDTTTNRVSYGKSRFQPVAFGQFMALPAQPSPLQTSVA